jgi:O-antigen/teichoic acid export membrane protein
MLSGFSEVKSDRDLYLKLYVKVQSLILLVVVPVGLGLAIIAPDFIPLFLGAGWDDTIFFVQLITVMMVVQMTSINFLPAIVSLGKTRVIMWRSMIYVFIRPTFFIFGVVKGGLIGAVYGYCAAGIFLTLIENIILFTVLKLSIYSLFQRIWRIIIAAGIMVTVCLTIDHNFLYSFNHMTRLIVLILTGGISYILVIMMLWNISGRPVGAESQIIELIKRKF